jgi:hypothetical protein
MLKPAEHDGERLAALHRGVPAVRGLNMPKAEADILLTFPARMLSPTEQSLVQEWIGLANDVPLAICEPTTL